MIIRICYFTKRGQALAEKLISARPELTAEIRKKEVPLEEWTAECFSQRLPILFIGASGIAVRAIAPFVKDKLADSAVLVADEKGRFVIPLLSGHMGAANELAEELAETLQATPVLTTATDVEGIFSIDVFARKNALRVVNREGIRMVSSKLLRGENIKIWIASDIAVRDGNYPKGVEVVDSLTEEPDVIIRRAQPLSLQECVKSGDAADCELKEEACLQEEACLLEKNEEELAYPENCLILETKEYVIGMGCKKDKSYEEIMEFLWKCGLSELEQKLYALASIEIKKSERGLQGAAQYLRVPFRTYTAEELNALEGEFTESDFVRQTTGVPNVCERAAVLCAGEGAKLVGRKIAENGITFALARKLPEIVSWE